MKSDRADAEKAGVDGRESSPPPLLAEHDSPYWFCVDLHVHTRRFSDCAESLDPAQIPSRMRELGLGGLVLAEHDSWWSEEDVEEIIRPGPDIKIYRGVECSARGCHILIVGIAELGPLRKGIAPEEAVEYAHDQGGVAILAHPYRDSSPDSLPVHLFDGIEVGSTSFSRDDVDKSLSLARHYGACMVAGSDAHSLSRIGSAVTVFRQSPCDELELSSMIKAHQVEPRFNRQFPVW